MSFWLEEQMFETQTILYAGFTCLPISILQKKIEHLDLIEGIIVNILQTKWKCFIRREFFKQIFIFFIYFCLSMFVFVSRPMRAGEYNCMPKNGTGLFADSVFNMTTATPDVTTTSSLVNPDFMTTVADMINMTTTVAQDGLDNQEEEEEEEESCEEGQVAMPLDQCYMNQYETGFKQGRLMAEVVLVFFSLAYMIRACREASFLGRKIFKENLSLCPSRVIFLLGCILIMIAVPCRIFCLPNMEDNLAVLIMLFQSMYSLYFCR
jgi:transient receptor potential cation channel subfamily V protein 5